MLRSGLVSVTFRQLTPEEIISLTAKAGLEGIEWGGDIHVPAGDLKKAREVSRMTENAGLVTAAYGSYYRVGVDPNGVESFEKVLTTALELKAPTIRVWAGNKGSAEADEAWWDRIILETRNIADLCKRESVTVSFEYHGGTLTDTPESALRLMKSIDHPQLRCYWQPLRHLNREGRKCGLQKVLPWLGNIHVYHWIDQMRYSLAEGKMDWSDYFNTIGAIEGERFAMLEFVKEDDPACFLEDADTLKKLIRGDR